MLDSERDKASTTMNISLSRLISLGRLIYFCVDRNARGFFFYVLSLSLLLLLRLPLSNLTVHNNVKNYSGSSGRFQQMYLNFILIDTIKTLFRSEENASVL